MAKNASIIICSRPQSSRLPGKVFKKIAGIPAIEHILHRISALNIPIVVAVPYQCFVYDHLIDKFKIQIYRGNPDSPLHRMADAIDFLDIKSDWIIRITHDDILIDAETVLRLLEECERTKNCGYAYCPTIVEGAGVEIIHRNNLVNAAKDRLEPTEFVSYFVRQGKEIAIKPRKSIERSYRLTMDYPEDAIVLETILREVGALSSLDKIVEFIDRHPYVMNLNKQPLISIYTCAFNAQAYVERTVDSVLHHHSYSPLDMEYIFVDDGSIDSTLLKVSRSSRDPRLKIFVNEANKGLASSSNIALSHARGKYVMRLDADDFLLPNSIVDMLNKLDQDQSSVVYSSYREIDQNEQMISLPKDPRDHHHAGCALMDRRMINEIRFKDGLKHWDSKDLYHRIRNRFKISYIADQTMWLYRRHGKSLSADLTPEREKALLQVHVD